MASVNFMNKNTNSVISSSNQMAVVIFRNAEICMFFTLLMF